jgi:hypothetical protein
VGGLSLSGPTTEMNPEMNPEINPESQMEMKQQ